MFNNIFIHPSSDVQTTAIGENTKIWQYVVVLPGATIGSECNINSHCFIENMVSLGNRVTVKSGVQIWNGISIGDDVFIGPNVTFSNDKYPRSKKYLDTPIQTFIDSGASIGAGATILPGVKVGSNSTVGAGSVVTRSIPPNAVAAGNPARIIGYASPQHGHKKTNSSFECLNMDLVQPTVPGSKLIKLPKVTDIRGSLSVGEFSKSIPFDVKRYFLVYGVPSIETRGEHAHKTCHQFLVCASGRVSVAVNDGANIDEHLLDRPELGLYIPPMTWGVQYKYSSDAVLLVFASHYYDSGDYIRDYSEFMSLVGKL